MDRRSFLRSSALALGVLGAPGVLAACNRGGGDSGIPEGQPTLNPVIATYEVLTGQPRTLLFGLRTLDNVEVGEADVAVYLRDDAGQTVLAGPLETEYVTAPGTDLGLYKVQVEFDQPGNPQLVAVEGDRFGATALRVAAPEGSGAPAPGQPATVVATPTEGDAMGYEQLCTQDPPCGMHEVSLDEALDQGRPVMLTFATPAYCQTVICGPAVETIESVRADGEWGEVAWIHVEIYSKYSTEKQTPGKPVKAWELPSEPWLFSIGADGQIVDRLDGPMLHETIEEMATAITA